MSRADQKRAEKHKQKRAVAQRARASAALPTTMAALLRDAAARPFGPAWVAAAIHDATATTPALIQVVVTRRLPGGLLVPGMALVDRTCLGVKDGAVKGPTTEAQVNAIIATMSTRQPMVACDAHFAVSVVFHALDYAAALGFPPWPGFPALLFGARPSRLADTPLAKRDRPLYVTMPGDDVPAIVGRLEAAVGKDGYDLGVAGPDVRGLVESLAGSSRVAAAMLADDEADADGEAPEG